MPYTVQFTFHKPSFNVVALTIQSTPNGEILVADEKHEPDPAKQDQQRVQVDDSRASTSYANFCRVTGTPEELIIDFGLNAQPFGVPTEPVVITQRLVTNYFTAKRLLHALHLSVQRHEQAFGVLETDVQKRVVGKPQV
jgi:hypothetical protein